MPGIIKLESDKSNTYIDFVSKLSLNATRCQFKDYNGLNGRTVIVRHDVDNDLNKALLLAKEEYLAGIKSTYFLLHTAPYFKYSPKFIRKCCIIQDFGHDLGFHNNVITVWASRKKSLNKIINKPLNYLRNNGIKIVGTSAHGVPACYKKGYYNYEIWKEFDPNKNEGRIKSKSKLSSLYRSKSLSDYGLTYDANFIDYQFYLDDAGGTWNGVVVKNIKTFGKSVKFGKDNIGLKVLDKWNKAKEATFHFLVHPCWWNFY